MNEDTLSPEERRLVEAVRSACLRVAREAYEDAALRGLCAEGAWECAQGAIETLDLETVASEGAEK